MADESPDAALVRRAASGDGDAFALLYGRYKHNVWDLSYFLCQRNHHDAEEALQETFLKAWRSLHRYRASGTFKAWLLMICRNVCIDRVHRAPRRPVPLTACSEADLAGRSRDADRLDAIILRATLAELPRDECEAWLLVDVLGCTSEEVAGIVGARAASTVRSRVTRARTQIAAALRDEELEPVLPAPTEAELCGLYHSALEKAIVVASIQRSASARGGVMRVARARRASAAVADGCLRIRSRGLAVDANEPSRPALSIGDGLDLIGFLAELDGEARSGKTMVAIVDTPATTATARWCDRRPHWELQCAPAPGSWREEADRLLTRCAHPAAAPAGTVRAMLDAGEAFVWTASRVETLL